MKFYQQQGSGLQRTNLGESDNVCTCCQKFDHQSTEFLHDDVECGECGMLCRCACHRERRAV